MSTEDKSEQDSFECPWDGCDYTSESETSVKIHHANGHGESIAGTMVEVECSWCGEPLKRPRYDVKNGSGIFFCGEGECESRWKAENRSGENHPRYDGGDVTNVCEWCGEEYEVVPARADRRRFCGEECFEEWIQASADQFRGENAPRYSQKQVECCHCGDEFACKPYRLKAYDNVFCDEGCRRAWFAEVAPTRWQTAYTCQVCGKEDTRPESKANTRKYCSLECRDVALSGVDSVHWRGGYRLYRILRVLLPRPWTKTARKARERADRECQCCGRSASADEQALQVHHIVPVLSGGTNGDWNLLPLCAECHKEAEHHTRGLFGTPFTDWGDGELPEGRGRWSPDAASSLAD